MCLLFETIKVENRRLSNIKFHNWRFKKSRKALLGLKSSPDLENLIKIPKDLSDEIHKCRVVYGKKIERIEFEPYKPKIISSLKLVEDNNIDYNYKYADRCDINYLFEQRGKCDDILIIKNGFVTDISIANVFFWDSEKWITPSTPLLPGTMRQKLIEQKLVFETEIRAQDLKSFQKARIINCMMDQPLNMNCIKD